MLRLIVIAGTIQLDFFKMGLKAEARWTYVLFTEKERFEAKNSPRL